MNWHPHVFSLLLPADSFPRSGSMRKSADFHLEPHPEASLDMPIPPKPRMHLDTAHSLPSGFTGSPRGLISPGKVPRVSLFLLLVPS